MKGEPSTKSCPFCLTLPGGGEKVLLGYSHDAVNLSRGNDMNKKTLPIFLLLLAIVVVMISVLGRRVTTRQAASVAQSAQSVASEDGMAVAMGEEPRETRAIDRSTRHVTHATTTKTTAKSEPAERPYRRGRKPLPEKTEVAAATTAGDKSGGWVTLPGTGVGLWPKP